MLHGVLAGAMTLLDLDAIAHREGVTGIRQLQFGASVAYIL